MHVNENAKLDPSSKIFEVLHTVLTCSCTLKKKNERTNLSKLLFFQISKKWKLRSMEQQQRELESAKKRKEEAKQQAKKAAGNVMEYDGSMGARKVLNCR